MAFCLIRYEPTESATYMGCTYVIQTTMIMHFGEIRIQFKFLVEIPYINSTGNTTKFVTIAQYKIHHSYANTTTKPTALQQSFKLLGAINLGRKLVWYLFPYFQPPVVVTLTYFHWFLVLLFIPQMTKSITFTWISENHKNHK